MLRLAFALGVVTTLTAPAFAASINLQVVVTPQQFGAVCDGRSHPLSDTYSTLAAAQAVYPFITSLSQETDYAALKAASNAAFGADGTEHGSGNPTANEPLLLPNGACELGADTWTIRALSGGTIRGAGTTATRLEGNGPVLAFDGLWYSEVGNFSVRALTTAEGAMDVDGNVPGHPYATFGVQGNRFPGLNIDGGGGWYALALCRQGGSGGQCSENTFDNFHGINASFAVYYQNGFDAIDNVFLGGDMQGYPANGAYLIAGSAKFLGMSFESTTGYAQIANNGCDINASAGGAGDSILALGDRSESMIFYCGAWSQPAQISGFTHQPARVTWAASTSYPLNTLNSIGYRVTTAGTSGSTEPTWTGNTVTDGTVTDGTVTWTWLTYYAISIAEGSIDFKSSSLALTDGVIAGSVPNVQSCGDGATVAPGSTRYHGSVTEGTNATGCSLALNFAGWGTIPAWCVVSSPTGSSLSSYSYSGSGGVLSIANPTASGNRYAWYCEQGN